MKYSMQEIENLLWEEELNLEQIIDIKKELRDYNLVISDADYLEELLHDCLDCVDTLEELKKIREVFVSENFDTHYVDKLIKRKSPITNDELDLLDKDDLEYYIYDGEEHLDLEGLLRVKYNSSKYDYDDFTLEGLDKEIEEEISCIEDIDELERIKKVMIDYEFDIDYISKMIYNLKRRNKEIRMQNEKQNKMERELYRNAFFSGLFSGLFSSGHKKKNTSYLMPWESDLVKKGDYDSWSFEEEELDEDDYYYEDD